jgi:hypothetical protein
MKTSSHATLGWRSMKQGVLPRVGSDKEAFGVAGTTSKCSRTTFILLRSGLAWLAASIEGFTTQWPTRCGAVSVKQACAEDIRGIRERKG